MSGLFLKIKCKRGPDELGKFSYLGQIDLKNSVKMTAMARFIIQLINQINMLQIVICCRVLIHLSLFCSRLCYALIFALLNLTHLHATAHCLPLVLRQCTRYYTLCTYTITEVVSDISRADLNVLTDAGADMNSWIVNFKTAMNCKSHKEETKEKLMTHTKETLIMCLLEGYQTVFSHKNKFESSKACLEQLKLELIAAQRSVVKLQQQIIDTQEEQMNMMSTVVDTAVDKVIQSYSHGLSEEK